MNFPGICVSIIIPTISEKFPKYEQIYYVMENDQALRPIREAAIDRYWDTFIVDALIANFDRHIGNWAYIYHSDTGQTTLAPVYDCGSTLYPSLNEQGMQEIAEDPMEKARRVYQFPTAALLYKGVKVSYRDMIRSGLDERCTAALRRISERIDLGKINAIIDHTLVIGEIRKRFYKDMIAYRKAVIVDNSLQILAHGYDEAARERVEKRIPFNSELFERMYKEKY